MGDAVCGAASEDRLSFSVFWKFSQSAMTWTSSVTSIRISLTSASTSYYIYVLIQRDGPRGGGRLIRLIPSSCCSFSQQGLQGQISCVACLSLQEDNQISKSIPFA